MKNTARIQQRLVLHVDVHPAAVSSAARNIGIAVTTLHECGVHVRTIGVMAGDSMDELLAALRKERVIDADVVNGAEADTDDFALHQYAQRMAGLLKAIECSRQHLDDYVESIRNLIERKHNGAPPAPFGGAA